MQRGHCAASASLNLSLAGETPATALSMLALGQLARGWEPWLPDVVPGQVTATTGSHTRSLESTESVEILESRSLEPTESLETLESQSIAVLPDVRVSWSP
jgi:hypothetical protein